MLKIVSSPINNKVLFTIPWEKWPELTNFTPGIVFEYSDNYLEDISFQFFYIPGRISVLMGPWIEDFSEQEIKVFFDTQISLSELWTWLDNQVPFKILEELDKDDVSITGVWKMSDLFLVEEMSKDLLNKYFMFQVSTVTVRCLPYNAWSRFIKYDTSDEHNKIYWITLCLLKYQRQLKQQSEG